MVMDNKIKKEINNIKIPEELHNRSKLGVLKAKNEKQRNRKVFSAKRIVVAAGLLACIGTISFLTNNFDLKHAQPTPSENTLVVTESGGVKIPMIQLPEDTTTAKMLGLLVYNGRIYTQTGTEIRLEDAKALVGEKLGVTKGNIDEWSKQKDYDKEFASSIGIADVYSVKGYDKDFRVMVYVESDGYAEFYESLNGITVDNGGDVFGKLKMAGNVSTAQYRMFSDWDNGINNYQPIGDKSVLDTFIENLNKAKPLLREMNSDPIVDLRSDEEFKELIIHLNDGSKISLKLLKGSYIYYGYMDVYFKMDDDAFSKMWSQLQ
jgi:hypothetical protein